VNEGGCITVGETVAPALRRAIERVGARLEALGIPALRVAIGVGLDDPGLARRLAPEVPRVLVPALNGRNPTPWAQALLRSADAVVLLDATELRLVAPRGAPTVLAGLPRPEEAAPAKGLDTGSAPDALVELWRTEVGEVPAEGPGVAWVGGGGSNALAEAADAWARGRAVVTLPGSERHGMLSAGGALPARAGLELIEATRLLCAARPLTRALAQRGRRRVSELDPVEVVAERFFEAAILAQESAA
jgi:hypothetical protein